VSIPIKILKITSTTINIRVKPLVDSYTLPNPFFGLFVTDDKVTAISVVSRIAIEVTHSVKTCGWDLYVAIQDFFINWRTPIKSRFASDFGRECALRCSFVYPSTGVIV